MIDLDCLVYRLNEEAENTLNAAALEVLND